VVVSLLLVVHSLLLLLFVGLLLILVIPIIRGILHDRVMRVSLMIKSETRGEGSHLESFDC